MWPTLAHSRAPQPQQSVRKPILILSPDCGGSWTFATATMPPRDPPFAPPSPPLSPPWLLKQGNYSIWGGAASTGSKIRMHPITLSFLDPNLDEAFRIEAASRGQRAASLNFTQAAVWAAMATSKLRSLSSPCARMWPIAIPVLMASLGMLTNMCIGRLGNRKLEQLLLVRLGAAAMVGGAGATIVCAHTAVELPEGCPTERSIYAPLLSSAWGLFASSVLAAMTIAQHIFAFPFWARITSPLSIIVAPAFVPHLTPEPKSTVVGFLVFLLTVSDIIGHSLQRSIRIRFVAAKALPSSTETCFCSANV